MAFSNSRAFVPLASKPESPSHALAIVLNGRRSRTSQAERGPVSGNEPYSVDGGNTDVVQRVTGRLGFLKYGNHCGPMHGSATAPAIDAVDAACKVHDKCYETSDHHNCDLAFQASGLYGTPMKFILHTKGLISHPLAQQTTSSVATGILTYLYSRCQSRLRHHQAA
jgi:hypothetical protein